MKKPNLNIIIEDNLDKTKFQSKKQPSLPSDEWLNKYTSGGTYLSDRAQATQFGQYKMGGGMFPPYHSFTPPRMNNGGGLLSRKVTCSNCGWSWDAVDGGKDVMTCHHCGGMIKMQNGGDISIPDLEQNKWVSKYGPGGATSDGCPPNFTKNAFGQCVNSSGQTYDQANAFAQTIKGVTTQNTALSSWKPGMVPISNLDGTTGVNDTAAQYKVAQSQKIQPAIEQYMKKYGVNYKTAQNAINMSMNNQNTNQNATISAVKPMTAAEKANNLRIKQQFVANNPGTSALDENNNIIQTDPYYGVEGTPVAGTTNARAIRGLQNASKVGLGVAGTMLTAGTAPVIAEAAYLPESFSVIGSGLGKAATPLLAAATTGILGKTATDKISNPYSIEEKIKLHPKYDANKSLESQMNLANDNGVYNSIYRAAHSKPFENNAANFAWDVGTSPARAITNFTQPQQYMNKGWTGLALAGLDAASIFTELPGAAYSAVKSGAPALLNRMAPSIIKQEGINVADATLRSAAHNVEHNAFKHLGKEAAEGSAHQGVHQEIHSAGHHATEEGIVHKRLGGKIGKYRTGGWLDNHI